MNSNIILTIRIIATLALLALAVGAFSLPALAQNNQGQQAKAIQKGKPAEDFTIGKKGEVHFNIQVKAGGIVLKPGMYQVQHTVEGSEHVVIFKEMSMPAGYKMGNTPVGKEVARIKCRVEPVTKKVNNTKITLRTDAAGEKEIAEVQIGGEAFKHLM
ncbi:MAG: hypothetical protein MOB07_19995 [Acidobacteria bacterium]|nr:hypothetical protein [Acidobacteriota bacterium]